MPFGAQTRRHFEQANRVELRGESSDQDQLWAGRRRLTADARSTNELLAEERAGHEPPAGRLFRRIGLVSLADRHSSRQHGRWNAPTFRLRQTWAIR